MAPTIFTIRFVPLVMFSGAIDDLLDNETCVMDKYGYYQVYINA